MYFNKFDFLNNAVGINSASKVADKVISLLNIKTEDKQTILETFDILERIKKVNDLFINE